MRITLVHNAKAGKGEHSRTSLIRAIESAGHEVRYLPAKGDLRSLRRDPADLVVVAGGDGTVADVTKHLLGSSKLLTILPVGTANNIAGAMGLAGHPASLIRRWASSRAVRFHPGTIRGGSSGGFLESAGFGLFAELLVQEKKSRERQGGPRSEQLRRKVRKFRAIAREFQPRHWSLSIDGRDYSGRYLLVEVMNIRAIGPALQLAPSADPSDRLLDVVMVEESDRDELFDYLSRRLEREDEVLTLPARRAQRVSIRLNGSPFHVDDQLWPKNREGRTIKLGLGATAIAVLVPR